MHTIPVEPFKKKYAALAAKASAAELETLFASAVKSVQPLFDAGSAQYLRQGKEYIDCLAKPPGSLGRLEELALALYCLEARKNGRAPEKLCVDPGMLFTVAADHGVVAEGVSPYPQEMTRRMVQNFLHGGAAINAMCRNARLDFLVVDAGVLGPDFAPHPALIQAKIARGSANIAQGPALGRKEGLKALLLGLELAGRAAGAGCKCLAAGEMGIGNTTPSSALFCALLKLAPEEAAGPGAGLDPKLLSHKASVIARALQANQTAIQQGDPVGILSALGGIEIAVMSGLMLGAAANRLPMLIDGFIAGAAFTAARAIAPAVQDYCIFAHCSAETAHGKILGILGKKPLLDLGLRLGEGTGAALGMNILRGAVHMFNDMACLDPAKAGAPAF